MNIRNYTDGACSGNPGPGGAAYIILDGNKQVRSDSVGFVKTTNNRMEMWAAIMGLKETRDYILKEKSESEEDISVTLLTDSQVVEGTLNKGWKRNKNNDFWEEIDQAIEKLSEMNVRFYVQKVKGHDGVKYNEMVDKMAVNAYKLTPGILMCVDTNYQGTTEAKTSDKSEDGLITKTIQYRVPREAEQKVQELIRNLISTFGGEYSEIN